MALIKKQEGFTLIELLVVISIIGFLSTIMIIATVQARQKAKIAKTKKELATIITAIYNLSVDTGRWPNGCPPESADSAETMLNSSWAGMLTSPQLGFDAAWSTNPGGCGWTAADIAQWRGPYVDRIIDPWGNSYFYDPDFRDIDNVYKPAVESFGVNGVQDYYGNGLTTDDIVTFIPGK